MGGSKKRILVFVLVLLVLILVSFVVAVPLGKEFKVNNDIEKEESVSRPKIIMDKNGDYVVFWLKTKYYSSLKNPYWYVSNIYAKRFKSDGTSLSDEIKIIDITPVHHATFIEHFTYSRPGFMSASLDPNGNFLVAWFNRYGPVYAKKYDINTKTLGDSFEVTPEPDFNAAIQNWPSVAMQSNGDFIVAWENYKQSIWSVLPRNKINTRISFFDSQGNKKPIDIEIPYALKPFIIVDDDDNFIVIWKDQKQDGYGSESGLTYAQKYNADGEAIGQKFLTHSSGDSDSPAQISPNGDLVTVWEIHKSSSSDYLNSQRYRPDGTLVGERFVKEYFLIGYPSIAMNDNGNYVLVWHARFSDSDEYDIYAQRFLSDGTLFREPFLVSERQGSHVNPSVAIDNDNNFIIVWLSRPKKIGENLDVMAKKYPFCVCSEQEEGVCHSDNNKKICDGCDYIDAPEENCNKDVDNNCDGQINEGCDPDLRQGLCKMAWTTTLCEQGVDKCDTINKDIRNGYCCGDDTNEYYDPNHCDGAENKHSCCDNPNDFVDKNGNCVETCDEEMDISDTSLSSQRFEPFTKIIKSVSGKSSYMGQSSQTPDGGFIISGQKGREDKHPGFLLKTDLEGNEEWQKTYIDKYNCEYKVTSFKQTPDGGYILLGYIWGTNCCNKGSKTALVIKTDSEGNTCDFDDTCNCYSNDYMWIKNYAGTTTSTILQIADGYMFVTKNNDIPILTKINFKGNRQWSDSVAEKKQSVISLQETSDNNYIGVFSTSGGTKKGLIKINEQGNQLWTKIYRGYKQDPVPDREKDSFEFVQQTSDGGYILGGITKSFGNKFWLIKTDENGNTCDYSVDGNCFANKDKWAKTFSAGAANYLTGSLVRQTSDEGYIFASRSSKNYGVTYTNWLIKTDENGNTCDYSGVTSSINCYDNKHKWVKTYNLGTSDYIASLYQVSETEFVVTGKTIPNKNVGYPYIKAISSCNCLEKNLCENNKVCDGCSYIGVTDEVCGDDLDNNCDGTADEGCDADKDGISDKVESSISSDSTDVEVETSGVDEFKIEEQDDSFIVSDGEVPISEFPKGTKAKKIKITKNFMKGFKRGNVQVSGFTLPEGKTKTTFVDKLGSGNYLCIFDTASPPDLDELKSCTGIKLPCPGNVGDYACTLEGDQYKVTGLKHTTLVEFNDIDQDGYDMNQDCDDNNALINQGATEVCDGVDNNCVLGVDEGCECISGTTQEAECGIGECNNKIQQECVLGKWDPEACAPKLSKTEICNGKDDDCDGGIDNDLTSELADKQDGVCSGQVKICASTNGLVEPDYSMIDDYSSTEVCGDGKDNDCDGDVDEGCCECSDTLCNVANNGKVCDGCNYVNAPSEVCDDNKDNNCNGQVNDGCSQNLNTKTCTDTDHIDFLIPNFDESGTVTYTDNNGEVWIRDDACDGKKAYDYVCQSDGLYQMRTKDCPDACDGGVCVDKGISVTETIQEDGSDGEIYDGLKLAIGDTQGFYVDFSTSETQKEYFEDADVNILYYLLPAGFDNVGYEISLNTGQDYMKSSKIGTYIFRDKDYDDITVDDCDKLWKIDSMLIGVGIDPFDHDEVVCILTKEGQIAKIHSTNKDDDYIYLEWEYMDSEKSFKCQEDKDTNSMEIFRGDSLLTKFNNKCIDNSLEEYQSYSDNTLLDFYCEQGKPHINKIICENKDCNDDICVDLVSVTTEPAIIIDDDIQQVTTFEDNECGGSKKCECGDELISDYIMTEDLGPCPETALMIINTDDITLDCNGQTITFGGTDGYYGIYVRDSDRITIKNCNVNGWKASGIDLSGSNYLNLLNNHLSYNDIGISLSNSHHNIIKDNVANNNYEVGFWIGGSYNTLTGNTANNNYNTGFRLRQDYNILKNNIAKNNIRGFTMRLSTYHLLENNIAENNTNDGFEISDSNYITLSNNVVRNEERNTYNEQGIAIIESHNNILKENIIETVESGFYLLESENNEISENILKNNVGASFVFHRGSENNIFKNNNILDTDNYYVWYLDADKEFNVENNYWGTTDCDLIKSKIADFNHDQTSNVDYTPLLDAPYPDGVAVECTEETTEVEAICTEGETQTCGDTTTNDGLCHIGIQTCTNNEWSVCEGEVSPDVEVCDGVNDENCDGQIDEGCNCINGNTRITSCGVGVCKREDKQQTCLGGQWMSECTPDISKKTDEVCNDNLDNDCDGEVDNGIIKTLYEEKDGDGFGNINSVEQIDECELPDFLMQSDSMWTEDTTDCNDDDYKINPNADEVCNDNKDNDCDNLIDYEDTDDCIMPVVVQQCTDECSLTDIGCSDDASQSWTCVQSGDCLVKEFVGCDDGFVCENNACIEEVIIPTCTDECSLTDIGCSDDASQSWTCVQSGDCLVKEFSDCDNNYFCLDGSCNELVCTDSDNGKDFNVKGSVLSQEIDFLTGDIIDVNSQDKCINVDSFRKVIEKNDQGISYEPIDICLDNELDDDNILEVGECEVNSFLDTDNCDNNNCFVREVYCENKENKFIEARCLYGCQGGACLEEPECQPITEVCDDNIDNDCDSLIDMDDDDCTVVVPTCADECSLTDVGCSDDVSQSWTCVQSGECLVKEFVGCGAGFVCENNACVEEVVVPTCADECSLTDVGCSDDQTHMWTCVQSGDCLVKEFVGCGAGFVCENNACVEEVVVPICADECLLTDIGCSEDQTQLWTCVVDTGGCYSKEFDNCDDGDICDEGVCVTDISVSVTIPVTDLVPEIENKTKINLNDIKANSNEIIKELKETKKLSVKIKEKDTINIIFNNISELDGLDLSDINITKQNSTDKNAFVVFKGLNQTNVTKTIYLDRVNSKANAICIKDAAIENITEISSNCKAENEFIVKCPGVTGKYVCKVSEQTYNISGLSHSGVIEFVVPSSPTPAPSESDDSGSGSRSGGSGGGGGYILKCNDKKDNDNDGLIDLDDPGCKNKYDNNESNAATCDDNAQNQGEEDVDCGGPCAKCLVEEVVKPKQQSEVRTQPELEQPSSIEGAGIPLSVLIISNWVLITAIFITLILVILATMYIVKKRKSKQFKPKQSTSLPRQQPMSMHRPQQQGLQQQRPLQRPQMSMQEQIKRKRIISRLELYIRGALVKGYTYEMLRAHLVRNGWPANVVDEVINKIKFSGIK